MRQETIPLLERLLLTHAPSGVEGEMDDLCLAELAPLCADVRRDEAGNIIGLIRGAGHGSPIRLMAHKDEIGCLVARVDDDGRMRLEALGGAQAWVYGEGPMDVLGDEIVTGVLGIGSKHTSELSADIHAAKTTKPMSWDVVRLDCRLTRDALTAKGIGVGSRVCVARSRKHPLFMGDYVAGYAIDDKAAVAALLLVGRILHRRKAPPPCDVYLCMTSAEEPGIQGAAYAARTLPGETVIAVDVAPVAPEYPVELTPNPVVVYKDAVFIYDKPLSDALCTAAESEGYAPQRMVVRGYGSDASHVVKYGLTARAVLIGLPTANTHGYEIIHQDSIEACARVLVAHIVGAPTSRASRRRPRAR